MRRYGDMEELIVTTPEGPVFPGQSPRMRQIAREMAMRNAAAAYQTVAWRAPAAHRFDGRPANDFVARADAVVMRDPRGQVPAEPMPRWLIFAIGAIVAAVLGALLGAMMSL